MYKRIGLVLVVDQDAMDGMNDAGVALFRAFNYIGEKHTPAKALSFITDVSKDILVFLLIWSINQRAYRIICSHWHHVCTAFPATGLDIET